MTRLALKLVILLCAAAVSSAQAQDNKVSKEREALRRAQAALRTAQEQQGSLQADKAKAEAQAAAAEKLAAVAQARVGGSLAKLKASEAELATLRSQLQAAQAAAQQALALAHERDQTLQQQVQIARQESAERLQANQAISGLLERSVQALANAEAKNHELYAIGQALVNRYLGRSKMDQALLEDPVLGLVAVRFEDQAEALRSELAARKLGR